MINEIKKQCLEARKKGDKLKALLLNTLIAEIEKKAKDELKEVSNETVFETIGKFIKDLNRSLEVLKEADRIEQAATEKLILQSFLPKQLSDSELKETIEKILKDNNLAGKAAMGVVMKTLREKYVSQYEPAKAKIICESLVV